tara:strand:- start:188 stop:505 length:318 start_codon:yes stop_codon:yes gene_type:complete
MDSEKHRRFRENIGLWHEGAALIRTVYSEEGELLFEEWQCPKCEQKYKLWSKLNAEDDIEPGLDMVRRIYVSRPPDSKLRDPMQHSACIPMEKERLTKLQLWSKG